MNDRPQQHATYKGDARNVAEEGQVVGPNLLGEYLRAVTADYDPMAGTTRVGFAYVPKSALDAVDAITEQVGPR